jgi:uncharacterized membrane protein YhhN
MIAAKGLLRVFILLSIVYLSGIIFNLTDIIFYLKPALLLPLIIAAFTSTAFKNKLILGFALIFSWAGDTLLLFVFKDAIYFILGLVAFLIAHICYIVLFKKELKKEEGKITFKNPVLLIIFIYLAVLLTLLIPHLGGLTVPVIIYAIVISTMLYMAYLLSLHWPKPASIFLFTGAISFILSDSILAINKFYQPLPMAGFLIMATYLYAQWSLVKSCLKKQ